MPFLLKKTGFLLSFAFQFHSHASEVEFKALVFNPQYKNALETSGFKTQEAKADKKLEIQNNSNTEVRWPSDDERKHLLESLPNVKKISRELSWDTFELDKFFYLTAQKRIGSQQVMDRYPSFSKKEIIKIQKMAHTLLSGNKK